MTIYNVLFLCTANSARSIMAEAIINKDGAYGSAPSRPDRGRRAPCIPMPSGRCERLGHDTAFARSKSWDEFAAPDAPHMDFVFTVCDQAAAEECPIWPGHPASAHWGIPDPAAAEGNEAERALAFAETYRLLCEPDIAAARTADPVARPAGARAASPARSVPSPTGPRRDARRPPAPPRGRSPRHRAAPSLTVVGSGIMADALTDEAALALLCNTIATGAILAVLVRDARAGLGRASQSGGQPRPRPAAPNSAAGGGRPTSLLSSRRRDRRMPARPRHVRAFAPVDLATSVRSGSGQWLAEAVATFGLVASILAGARFRAGRAALAHRALHHRRLLVHRLDELRQPGRDHRPQPVGHLRCPSTSGILARGLFALGHEIRAEAALEGCAKRARPACSVFGRRITASPSREPRPSSSVEAKLLRRALSPCGSVRRANPTRVGAAAHSLSTFRAAAPTASIWLEPRSLSLSSGRATSLPAMERLACTSATTPMTSSAGNSRRSSREKGRPVGAAMVGRGQPVAAHRYDRNQHGLG